jgi:hypothetical protein
MWCAAGLEAEYGYFSVQGARQGVEYTKTSDFDAAKVNDFKWIREKFIEWTQLNG